MFEMEEREDIRPICPHCEKELTKVYFQKLRDGMKSRNVFFCPHCRKVLGFSYRKRFL